MRASSVLAIVCVLASFVAGQDSDSHTLLKFKGTKAGDTRNCAFSYASNGVVSFKDLKDAIIQDGKEIYSTEESFTEKVLESPDEKQGPTRLTRVYAKQDQEVNGAKKKASFVGKTLIIEKKEGKYRFQIEGGAVIAGDEALDLDDEFNVRHQPDWLYELIRPMKAVKVGESWTPDSALIGKDLAKLSPAGEGLVAGKVSAEVQLKKVYNKNGHKFGQIDVAVQIEVLGFKQNDKQLLLDTPGKMVISGTLDQCIDGTRGERIGTLTFRYDCNSKCSVDGQPAGTFVANGTGKAEDKIAPVDSK